ncbi:MAG: hypothetical protein Q4D89_05675, partial [Arachnia propionica]|nr:hypothetical protein [Arachnia propionica]
RERGAHYLLTVKKNQPTLHQELQKLPWKNIPAPAWSDHGHGRRVCHRVKTATAEIKRLRRENAWLRRVNEILKTASAFSPRSRAAPRRDDHAASTPIAISLGSSTFCTTLQDTKGGYITSRRYRAAKRRAPSARALSDEVLTAELKRIHAANHGVYGIRKMRVCDTSGRLTDQQGPDRPFDAHSRPHRGGAGTSTPAP